MVVFVDYFEVVYRFVIFSQIQIHIIKEYKAFESRRYLCGIMWDSNDAEIVPPEPYFYYHQLCKKCAKKLPGRKTVKKVLPDNLFEI